MRTDKDNLICMHLCIESSQNIALKKSYYKIFKNIRLRILFEYLILIFCIIKMEKL